MSYTSSLSSFTSESVCSGHPDKVCDAISDAIVDAVLSQDPHGKTAIETLVTENRIVIAGEVNSSAKIDCEKIARKEIARLSYTEPKWGFSDKSKMDIYVHQQSPEIAVGVEEDGAGDQGMMFGFACNETPQLMPLPITLAHGLTKRLDEAREKSIINYLRPDGKAQVTVSYRNGQPQAVTNVVLAAPHSEDVDLHQVKNDLYKKVVIPVLKKFNLGVDQENLIVNGTGIWHMPGPASDTGVTGRKIVVDGYGGYARVGGGCFSGKDPSKVDRSGAYAARFIAKNIVAAGLADRAEVILAYFIGAKQPIMQEVETFDTNKVSKAKITEFANSLLDTSVSGIIKGLRLARPIYHQTAAYGHFGRTGLPWEKVVSK